MPSILHIMVLFLFSIHGRQSLNLYESQTIWLKEHLARTKRSDNALLTSPVSYSFPKISFPRPCPNECNCNYDTINCNDLIKKCDECVHWPQIDFNQIEHMKTNSFKNYKFAPNRTTHIIFYKLLNSTLGPNTFNAMNVTPHSQIEITFQYNSLIKFDKYSLSGLDMDVNSTLVFNFPYTTQVVFLAKCFDGVLMRDEHVKLIIRILKSFSVQFLGTSLTNIWWSLTRGQLIIDIKSTHLVKFEENSLANVNLTSNAKLYVDLELIEKLMVQANTFAHVTLHDTTRMVFYAKQITFLDLRAYSFAWLTMRHQSQIQVYLDELTSSLCVQTNVFSNLRLESGSTFNFSVINSKNVQIMRDAFSSAALGDKTRLFVGVFNMPSLLLLHQNQNFYQNFLKARVKYLWPQHSHLSTSSSSLLNNEYFYSHLNINNGLNTIGLTSRLTESNDFFFKNKQAYSYNVSIEAKSFAQMTSLGTVFISSDNIHTLFIDDDIFDERIDVNFLVNVKHFVLSPRALSNVKHVSINLLRQPNVFKFGVVPSSNGLKQDIRINGLIFNDSSSSVFDGFCNLTSVSSKNTFLTLENTQNTCTCQNIYFLHKELNLTTTTLPCDLDKIEECLYILKNECKYKNETSFLKDYTKFWLYCLTESEMSLKEDYTKLHIDGFYGGLDEYALSTSSSSLLTPYLNGAINETIMQNNSLGKLIGLGIICFVSGIVLLMIAINLVQYKFRNDLLDDLECSSSHNMNSVNGGGFNQTYSGVSLSKNNTIHDNECNDELVQGELTGNNREESQENADSYFDEEDEEFIHNQQENTFSKCNENNQEDYYYKTTSINSSDKKMNDVVANDSGKFSESSSSSDRIEENFTKKSSSTKWSQRENSQNYENQNRKIIKS